MPHEVIMPALGMAQDSGVIVSWLKSAGDPVSLGDALFEVETDKATMEVEAQADGYLTDLQAEAGAEVPVGRVIALISETPENSGLSPDPHDTPEEIAASPEPVAVEGAEVIMPALGMAQDSGLIVAWARAPGDAVAADDVLLEVETDKATMEVPAGHDGYVAALLAEAGEEVPVGRAIAVISAERPAHPVQRSIRGAAPAAAPPAPEASAPVPAARTGPRAAPAAGGRILASPKARRLAAEEGLDLARLRAAGHPEPYHAADLEVLRSLPAAAQAPGTGGPALPDRITARVPRAGLTAFRDWMADETGQPPSPAALWAALASAALRAAGSEEAPLSVRVEAPATGRAEGYTDADRSGLASLAPAEDGAPALILRDLTGTRLTDLRLGADAVPVLTVTEEGDDYRLALECPHGRLSGTAAVTLISEFGARVEDPLRQLL